MRTGMATTVPSDVRTDPDACSVKTARAVLISTALVI